MTTRRWLLLLIVTGVALRLGLWTVYEPVAYPDTGTYMAAAKDLLAADLARSEGRRTPGYPLMVALAGLEPHNVWILQLVAGLLISVLLFYITVLMPGRPGFAFTVGTAYNVNLAQLFFEATLLAETTTTLGVVAVVATLLHAYRRLRDGQRASGVLLLLGVLAGFAILTRAQFVFLPLLLPALVAYASIRRRLPVGVTLRNAALTAVPALVLVFGWCAFVYSKTGFFTLSTQSGLGFVNQSIAFVEFAPDRYATIRDILLKHREAKLKEKGIYYNAIWDALPEIREATGMSLPEVSREVQRMSLELFVRHPVRYGIGVVKSWVSFWLVPNPWQLDRVTPRWLRSPLDAIWWVEHKLLRLTNALFILLVAAVVVSRRVRERTSWDLDLTSISVVILASSIVQALAEYGAGARYGVTVQALTVLVVLVTALRMRGAATAFVENPVAA